MRVLLITGGVFQALVALLHVVLIGWIENDLSLGITEREVMHMLNIAVMFSAGLLSYLSFRLMDSDLMTKIGSPVLLFIFVFYIVRGFEEFLFGQFSPISFGISMIISGIYLAAFFKARNKQALKQLSGWLPGLIS